MEHSFLQSSNIANVKPAGLGHEMVKLAVSLSANKQAPSELFLTEGIWAAEKLVRHQIVVQGLLFCPERISSVEEAESIRALADYAKEVWQISVKCCDKISQRQGADMCFCICEMPQYCVADLEKRIVAKKHSLIAILDGLEQPGNIGNILRSLDCAGADGVIVCNKRVKSNHARIIRASLGASFTMPIVEMSDDTLIAWLRKMQIHVYVTDLTATMHYYEPSYQGRIAIVAGNEFKGISPIWHNIEHHKIIIPMFGECESLNVGFATTMTAYEVALKQRQQHKEK